MYGKGGGEMNIEMKMKFERIVREWDGRRWKRVRRLKLKKIGM